ncbi:MAG: T9SS type A sorting domain-containing protein [Ignavibacteriae bacterium]|nr:T9SS type A sorting domain-containing protein [Ignavibacteriota bacterium]
MKKITIIFSALMFVLPVLLQAQYMGGNGRGDIKVSLTNINIPVLEITTELPTKYDLAQNYPNPFNPVTTIRYAIPRNSQVWLTVFDVIGREVETLINEKQSAGTYEAVWDASQIPSGVYFYRLTTNEFTSIKSMLLIK